MVCKKEQVIYVKALKGQCHEMQFFFCYKMLISTFCLSTDGFQGLSKAFNYSLAAGKMRKNYLETNGFRYDCTASQAVSCKDFQWQNRLFRVLEAKDWNEYKKLVCYFNGAS